MNREFSEAMLLYLDHCQTHRNFVVHPREESSEMIDDDWYLCDETQLIAIVTEKGNVGCVCTQHAMAVA